MKSEAKNVTETSTMRPLLFTFVFYHILQFLSLTPGVRPGVKYSVELKKPNELNNVIRLFIRDEANL